MSAKSKVRVQSKKRSSPRQSKKLARADLLSKQMTHEALLGPLNAEATGQDVLGHGTAVIIVCACANTGPLNLPRTLAELGVNGNAFQVCVFNGVRHAGYEIGLDDIPDSPTTTLIAAVKAIENAPKARPL